MEQVLQTTIAYWHNFGPSSMPMDPKPRLEPIKSLRTSLGMMESIIKHQTVGGINHLII